MLHTKNFEGAGEAFGTIVKDLLSAPSLKADGDAGQRMRQGSLEHLNYGFSLGSPRDRLSGEMKATVAAARFIWMMSSNNRLADIAFYEPKVLGFTDDGLTVPGSSYGMRLRQPQPGVALLCPAATITPASTSLREPSIVSRKRRTPGAQQLRFSSRLMLSEIPTIFLAHLDYFSTIATVR